MENYRGRKKKIERAEAGPCASWSAEGVNRKAELKSLDFRFGLRKGIMQNLPGSPWLPEVRVDMGAAVKVISWGAAVFALFPNLAFMLLLSIKIPA